MFDNARIRVPRICGEQEWQLQRAPVLREGVFRLLLQLIYEHGPPTFTGKQAPRRRKMTMTFAGQRLIRLPEVLRLTGLSRSNLYRKIQSFRSFLSPSGWGRALWRGG